MTEDLGSELAPTGHVLMDAAVTLYGALVMAVSALEACGHHDPHADRTLLKVIDRHRPHVNSCEIVEARAGRLFPGWRALCRECYRNYPCGTMRDVCEELGVALPGVLT